MAQPTAREVNEAWKLGKALAGDAIHHRRAASSTSILDPDPVRAAQGDGGDDREATFGDTTQLVTMMSTRAKAAKSRIAADRAKRQTEQLALCDTLMSPTAIKRNLSQLFRVACSHGTDLEAERLSHTNFVLFAEELGITTSTPYATFETNSMLRIRERISRREENVTQIGLLRVGTESLDIIFDYCKNDVADERLDFYHFLLALIEILWHMFPDEDLYPPLTKQDVHTQMLNSVFLDSFGSKYMQRQLPMFFNDTEVPRTLQRIVIENYSTLLDVFIAVHEPTRFTELSTAERDQLRMNTIIGDAHVEFECLCDILKLAGLEFATTNTEFLYQLFARYDTKLVSNRAVVDFFGLNLIIIHIAFSTFHNDDRFPTPQAKFVQLLEHHFVPIVGRSEPDALTRTKVDPISIDEVKPARATAETDMFLFGKNFPIKETHAGSHAPLYVQFGCDGPVVRGTTMSTTVASVTTPRLQSSEDSIIATHLSVVADRVKVTIETVTTVPVFISSDRLLWTRQLDRTFEYDDIAAEFEMPQAFVATLRTVFQLHAAKVRYMEDVDSAHSDFYYMYLSGWSKVCQTFPLGIADDGDPLVMIQRHPKFFETAKLHSRAPEIDQPCLTFELFINLVFKIFVEQHGADERILDYVEEAFKDAPKVIAAAASSHDASRRLRRRQGDGSGIGNRRGSYAQGPSQCANCGQDPYIRVTDEDMFVDLKLLKDDQKPDTSEALPVAFAKAIGHFVMSLPSGEEVPDETLQSLQPADAAKLSMRNQFLYLASIMSRFELAEQERFKEAEGRYEASISQIKSSGKFLTKQLLQLQQSMEAIADSVSRTQSLVHEAVQYTHEERKMRLSGSLNASDTLWAMTSQMFKGVEASLIATRDLTKAYLSDKDDSAGDMDIQNVLKEAKTFKERLVQQAAALERTIQKRNQEIISGPESAKVSKTVQRRRSEAESASDTDEEGREQQAGLSRKATSFALRGGVPEEEVANRLAALKEQLELQFTAKLKDLEKRKDITIKEGCALLYDLLRYTQERCAIPQLVANPCFKFLQNRGMMLKKVVFDDKKSGGMGTVEPLKRTVITDTQGVQSDENDFPSVAEMQSELSIRGLSNAVKLGPSAVMLRRALNCAREALSKYMNNPSLFQEFSQVIKLELQNVMNPRQRDMISMPAFADMKVRDSTTNTLLTRNDYDVARQYVAFEMQLEQLQAAVAASPKRGKGAGKAKGGGKGAAAAAAAPALAATQTDAGLTAEQRTQKKVARINMELTEEEYARMFENTKGSQTDPVQFGDERAPSRHHAELERLSRHAREGDDFLRKMERDLMDKTSVAVQVGGSSGSAACQTDISGDVVPLEIARFMRDHNPSSAVSGAAVGATSAHMGAARSREGPAAASGHVPAGAADASRQTARGHGATSSSAMRQGGATGSSKATPKQLRRMSSTGTEESNESPPRQQHADATPKSTVDSSMMQRLQEQLRAIKGNSAAAAEGAPVLTTSTGDTTAIEQGGVPSAAPARKRLNEKQKAPKLDHLDVAVIGGPASSGAADSAGPLEQSLVDVQDATPEGGTSLNNDEAAAADRAGPNAAIGEVGSSMTLPDVVVTDETVTNVKRTAAKFAVEPTVEQILDGAFAFPKGLQEAVVVLDGTATNTDEEGAPGKASNAPDGQQLAIRRVLHMSPGGRRERAPGSAPTAGIIVKAPKARGAQYWDDPESPTRAGFSAFTHLTTPPDSAFPMSGTSSPLTDMYTRQLTAPLTPGTELRFLNGDWQAVAIGSSPAQRHSESMKVSRAKNEKYQETLSSPPSAPKHQGKQKESLSVPAAPARESQSANLPDQRVGASRDSRASEIRAEVVSKQPGAEAEETTRMTQLPEREGHIVGGPIEESGPVAGQGGHMSTNMASALRKRRSPPPPLSSAAVSGNDSRTASQQRRRSRDSTEDRASARIDEDADEGEEFEEEEDEGEDDEDAMRSILTEEKRKLETQLSRQAARVKQREQIQKQIEILRAAQKEQLDRLNETRRSERSEMLLRTPGDHEKFVYNNTTNMQVAGKATASESVFSHLMRRMQQRGITPSDSPADSTLSIMRAESEEAASAGGRGFGSYTAGVSDNEEVSHRRRVSVSESAQRFVDMMKDDPDAAAMYIESLEREAQELDAASATGSPSVTGQDDRKATTSRISRKRKAKPKNLAAGGDGVLMEKMDAVSFDNAAAEIELRGMADLVRQMRARVDDLEDEKLLHDEDIEGLKDELANLRRQAIDSAQGRAHIVISRTGGKGDTSPLTQKQVQVARMIVAEKDLVRSRVVKLLRRYAPDVLDRFEQSKDSTGLFELAELMEKELRKNIDITTAQLRKSAADMCIDMLERHYPSEASSEQFQVEVQADKSVALRVAARKLYDTWRKTAAQAASDPGDSVYQTVLDKLPTCSVYTLQRLESIIASEEAGLMFNIDLNATTGDASRSGVAGSPMLNNSGQNQFASSSSPLYLSSPFGRGEGRSPLGSRATTPRLVNFMEDIFPVAEHTRIARRTSQRRNVLCVDALTQTSNPPIMLTTTTQTAPQERLTTPAFMTESAAGNPLEEDPSSWTSDFASTGLGTTQNGAQIYSEVVGKSFVDAEVQAVPFVVRRVRDLRMNERHTASQTSDDWSKVKWQPRMPWRTQLARLFVESRETNANTDVITNWVRSVFDVIRTKDPEFLSIIARQFDHLVDHIDAFENMQPRERTEESKIQVTMMKMMLRALEAANEMYGSPLSSFLVESASQYTSSRKPHVTRELGDLQEVNHLVTNLLSRIDVRLADVPGKIASSQRSLNRWRHAVIVNLLALSDKATVETLSPSELTTMERLCDFQSLTPQQQRRLFYLQVVTMSSICFGHASKRGYISIAKAVDAATVVPLSFNAPTAGHVRMAQQAILDKLVPPRFAEIARELSLVNVTAASAQFIAKVLTFSAEEHGFLRARADNGGLSTDDADRLRQLEDIPESLKHLNPSHSEMSTMAWLDALRQTFLNMVGVTATKALVAAHLTQPTQEPFPDAELQAHEAAVAAAAVAEAELKAEAERQQQSNASSKSQMPAFLEGATWRDVSTMRMPRRHSPPPPRGTPLQSPLQLYTPATIRSPAAFADAHPGSWGNRGTLAFPLRVAGVKAPLESSHRSTIAAAPQDLSRSLFHLSSTSSVRRVSADEQRKLQELRSACTGVSQSESVSAHIVRQWLDLELRSCIQEQRAASGVEGDIDLRELQQMVCDALAHVAPNAAHDPADTLRHLSIAQTRLFVQRLRGERTRGSRLPSLVAAPPSTQVPPRSKTSMF